VSSRTEEFLTEISSSVIYTPISITANRSSKMQAALLSGGRILNGLRRNEVDDTCDTVPVSITAMNAIVYQRTCVYA